MAGIRFLDDGRLILPSGATLDRGGEWLAPGDAANLLSSADFVIHRAYPKASDISADQSVIQGLVARVARPASDVGAIQYTGSGLTALVLDEFC